MVRQTINSRVKLLEHKHIIIRAEVLDPPRVEKSASEQVENLINNIGMKIMMGPYAKYCHMEGNRGLTVATIIETSHIVLHSWDEVSPALMQLDVYTCSHLDPRLVFKWMEQYNPVKIEHKYIDREFKLDIKRQRKSFVFQK
tara:strand:+ start:920 stop:1345 length:426 start_codon:yes stop_codon:yes gene_type:complete